MWNSVWIFILAVMAGAAVSAGTFAFVLVIGVVPRMLRKYHMAKYIVQIENVLMLGILAGVFFAVFPIDIQWHNIIGAFILFIYGIGAGIFVGGISVTLAEILDTFPILFHRFKITRGLSFIIFSLARGKMVGGFYYFVRGFWITGM